MSAVENIVDPDTQLALYRLHLQHETGRILLAHSEEEIKYNAALLARISHPHPETVPAPDAGPLNKWAELRAKVIAATVDADKQLRDRGISKGFLDLVYLNEEYELEFPPLTLVETEPQPETLESAPVEATHQMATPRLALVV